MVVDVGASFLAVIGVAVVYLLQVCLWSLVSTLSQLLGTHASPVNGVEQMIRLVHCSWCLASFLCK